MNAALVETGGRGHTASGSDPRVRNDVSMVRSSASGCTSTHGAHSLASAAKDVRGSTDASAPDWRTDPPRSRPGNVRRRPDHDSRAPACHQPGRVFYPSRRASGMARRTSTIDRMSAPVGPTCSQRLGRAYARPQLQRPGLYATGARSHFGPPMFHVKHRSITELGSRFRTPDDRRHVRQNSRTADTPRARLSPRRQASRCFT